MIMNISSYLKSQKESIPAITAEDLPTDPESVITVRFISLPLYGELLGVELLILNTLNSIAKKLNSKINLVAEKVKKRHNCKSGDVAGGVIDSLASNGIYTALKQGQISLYDPKGFEELLSLMQSKPYIPETLIFEDADTSLRMMAYAMTEELEKVQGKTVEDKIRNLSLKIPFVSEYALETVDINDLLEEVPGIYSDYEAYIFSRSPDLLLRVLLFTRCGIDHDVLFNLRLSETEKLIQAANSEIPELKTPKSNSAKAKGKAKAEVEDDTKSRTEPSSDGETESKEDGAKE